MTEKDLISSDVDNKHIVDPNKDPKIVRSPQTSVFSSYQIRANAGSFLGNARVKKTNPGNLNQSGVTNGNKNKNKSSLVSDGISPSPSPTAYLNSRSDSETGSMQSNSNSLLFLKELAKEDNLGKLQIVTKETSNDKLVSDITNNKRSLDEGDGSKPTANNTATITNVKRRRRPESCTKCRKDKAKCVYLPAFDSCEKCHRLNMPCSLTNSELSYYLKQKHGTSAENLTASTSMDTNATGNESLNENLSDIQGKLNLILKKLNRDRPRNDDQDEDDDDEAEEDIGENNANLFKNGSYNESPIGMMKKIDSEIFERPNKYNPFEKACNEFLKFYYDNEVLCLSCAKDFLEISQFWIIPGGIKEIDRKYVLSHPFITSVFVILAMCFEENLKYVEEQKKLYWITTRLLSVALITDRLTDHDLEAILYISIYNISRKPKQLEFDSWLISGIGLLNFINSIDLKGIIERNNESQNDSTDMFHLRIFNSLLICHLQNSIGSNKPIMISKDFINLNLITLHYPNAILGDHIKVCEIELYFKLNSNLESPNYFDDLKTTPDGLIYFQDLDDWKFKWLNIIDHDDSKMLVFDYNFASLILLRKLSKSDKFSSSKELNNTLYKYSIETLTKFMELPKSIIKGSPSFSLIQIIYSCITLTEIMDFPNTPTSTKQVSLNSILQLYWFLNKTINLKNDATDTLGKIVQSLASVADRKHNLTNSNTTPENPRTPSYILNNLTSVNTDNTRPINVSNSRSSSTTNLQPPHHHHQHVYHNLQTPPPLLHINHPDTSYTSQSNNQVFNAPYPPVPSYALASGQVQNANQDDLFLNSLLNLEKYDNFEDFQGLFNLVNEEESKPII